MLSVRYSLFGRSRHLAIRFPVADMLYGVDPWIAITRLLPMPIMSFDHARRRCGRGVRLFLPLSRSDHLTPVARG